MNNRGLYKPVLLICVFAMMLSCKQERVLHPVVFDSSFNGARLDSIEVLGADKYIVHIDPAFESVNKSPWFAFGVTAKSEKEIELQLDYGKY